MRCSQSVRMLPCLTFALGIIMCTTLAVAQSPERRSAFVASAPTATHVAQPGDTLLGIALRHGVPLDALRRANGLTRDTLRAGERLVIPAVTSRPARPMMVHSAHRVAQPARLGILAPVALLALAISIGLAVALLLRVEPQPLPEELQWLTRAWGAGYARRRPIVGLVAVVAAGLIAWPLLLLALAHPFVSALLLVCAGVALYFALPTRRRHSQRA